MCSAGRQVSSTKQFVSGAKCEKLGGAPWSHAIDQQLFVTQLDAQASTARTLQGGETI
jgi:hypothetical protein